MKPKVYLEEIWEDCITLRKQGDLTEFGYGQLLLVAALLDREVPKEESY